MSVLVIMGEFYTTYLRSSSTDVKFCHSRLFYSQSAFLVDNPTQSGVKFSHINSIGSNRIYSDFTPFVVM